MSNTGAPLENRKKSLAGFGYFMAVTSLLLPIACGGSSQRRIIPDGSVLTNACFGKWSSITGGDTSGNWVGCESGGTDFRLCGTPLPFSPTATGFKLNAVLANGDPAALGARVRVTGTPTWGKMLAPDVRAVDLAQWSFDGLLPATRYDYEILASEAISLYMGSVMTQRPAGDSFTFALISDSHIGPNATSTNQGNWCVLSTVAEQAGAASPDFIVNLGDMLDFHDFGFNEPPPDASFTRLAYLNYRRLLGNTLGKTAHFATIGNWEGEDGFYSADEIAISRQQRLLYVPGPSPTAYPQSGSQNQDYYAFTWGDALFIVLNVMSYTPTAHLLSYDPGLPDDWTLGEAQSAWFTNTLINANSKWKFVLIHHAVGGNAGNDVDSSYGRGGGRAANVGEQAKVHQWMLQYGVQIFFYGHDHVFTDMVVDGIHYTEPSNAGAIWMFDSSTTGYDQYWAEPGWGRVTVSPTAVNVQFQSITGEMLYQYTLK